MQITRCDESDVGDIVRLEKAYIECPWSEQNIMASLRNEGCVILKAVEGNETIGYAGVELVLDEGNILNIAVDEKFRRSGVASALMRELESRALVACAEKLFLEVNEKNVGAIELYSGLGFTAISERRRYYGDDSAIIMEKTLKVTQGTKK